MQTKPDPFLQLLQKKYPQYFAHKKVLEAGGETRRYFTNCSYAVHHGTHHTPVYRLEMPSHFDVIIHHDTLHYDQNWINTLCAMYRNLKSGGALIVTSAGPNTVLYGEEEEPPANYHALGTEELKALLPPNAFTTYQIGYAQTTHALEFFGVKK